MDLGGLGLSNCQIELTQHQQSLTYGGREGSGGGRSRGCVRPRKVAPWPREAAPWQREAAHSGALAA